MVWGSTEIFEPRRFLGVTFPTALRSPLKAAIQDAASRPHIFPHYIHNLGTLGHTVPGNPTSFFISTPLPCPFLSPHSLYNFAVLQAHCGQLS